MADAVSTVVEGSNEKKPVADITVEAITTSHDEVEATVQIQNDQPVVEAPSPTPKSSHDDVKPPPAKKLRLELDAGPSTTNTDGKPDKGSKPKPKFIYGNYNRYYSNRIQEDEEDVRMDAFKQHAHLFINKDVCDIGCNQGVVTMAVARDIGVKSIIGLDIDKELIGVARKQLARLRSNKDNNNQREGFPFNVAFKQCNYILDHEVLLDLVNEDFDTILCLSVTKWIHLNFGDAGLKLAFKRMYKQLRRGGHLILEAQPWVGYKRRKKLTPEIAKNFESIKMRPDKFREYLLSPEIGFSKCFLMEVPAHRVKGFRRPVQVFVKGEAVDLNEVKDSLCETDVQANGNKDLVDKKSLIMHEETADVKGTKEWFV